MSAIITTANDFFMSPRAISITLNALGDKDTLSASVYAGAKVTCYRRGIIDYNPDNNYRTWTIVAYNTHFEDTVPRYCHLAVSRVGDIATVVYPDTMLDLYGRAISDDGYLLDASGNPIIPDTSTSTDDSTDDTSTTPPASSSSDDDIEDTSGDYYFFFLGKISSSIKNGAAQFRTWEMPFRTGNLDTDQFRNEENLGEWSKMFRIDNLLNRINQLLPISVSNIIKLVLGENEKPIVDLIRSTDTDPIEDADQVIPSVGYANEQYLARTDDTISTNHQRTAQGEIFFHDKSGSDNFSKAEIPTIGTGWQITQRGDMIAESLVLRESLTVPELRYNRITTMHGVVWHTIGSDKILSVVPIDDESGIIEIDLDEGQFGSLREGDMCMGIWHMYDSNSTSYNPSKPNDALGEEEDEHNGNFHFTGFKTIYFKITEELDASGSNSKFKYVLRSKCERETEKPAADLIIAELEAEYDDQDAMELAASTNVNILAKYRTYKRWKNRSLWTDKTHPQPEMHIAAYANAEDEDRQACTYETITYKIQLVDMTDWIYDSDNIIKIDGELNGFTIRTYEIDENGNKVYSNTNLNGWGIAVGNMYMWGSVTNINRDPIIVRQKLFFMITSDSIEEVMKHVNPDLDDDGNEVAPDWKTYYQWSSEPLHPDKDNINLYEYWQYTYASGDTSDGDPFWVGNYTSSAVSVVFQHHLVPVYCKNIVWGDEIENDVDSYIYAEYDMEIENGVYLFVGDVEQTIISGEVVVDMSGQPNAVPDPTQVITHATYDNGVVKIGIVGGAFRIDENVDVKVTLHYGNAGSNTAVGHFLLVPNYEGADGNEGVGGFSAVTSFVFKRQMTKPAKPSGGSFANPVPEGWFDTVPTDSEDLIWMSKRIFYSDSHADTFWSEPVLMADSADFEVIYSEKETPAAPSTHPFDKDVDTDWIDDVSSEDVIWMATSRFADGRWYPWNVVKIKGEKGDPGDSYQETLEFYYATEEKDDSLPSHTVENHSGWSANVPTNYGKDRPYLWNFEIIYYQQHDGTIIPFATTPQLICYWGQDGRSIGSIQEKYIATEENESTPSFNNEGVDSAEEAGFSKELPKLYNREIIFDTDGNEIDRTAWQLIAHWGEMGESAVSSDLSNEVDTIGIGADGILNINSPITLSTKIFVYVGVTAQRITTLSTELVGVYVGSGISVVPVTASDSEGTYYTGEVNVTLSNGVDFGKMTTDGKFIVRINASCASVQNGVTKDFTIVGNRDAEDGEVYRLLPTEDSIVVTRDSENNKTYSNTVVGCQRYVAFGSEGIHTTEIGSLHYRIIDKTNEAASDVFHAYDEPVRIDNDNYTSIEFSWYSHDTQATGVLLDRESVPIIHWGNNGSSNYLADLSNEVDTIGVGSDNILDEEITLTTDYSLYYGSTQKQLSNIVYEVVGIGSNASSLVVVSDSGITSNTVTVSIKVKVGFDFNKCVDDRFTVKIAGQCSEMVSSIVKVFTVVGSRDAEDGTMFTLTPSVDSIVVTKDADNKETYSTTSITCVRNERRGAGAMSESSLGSLYYRIYSNNSFSTYKQYAGAVSVNNEKYASVEFTWFIGTSATGDYYDKETVPIVRWGNNGVGSFVADLSNEVDTVGTGDDDTLDVETPFSTVFKIMYGASVQTLTSLYASVSGIGSNASSKVVTSCDEVTGNVIITVKSGFNFALCTNNRFTVIISGICNGLSSSITKVFTICSTRSGKDGEMRFIRPSVSSVVVTKDASYNDTYNPSVVTCKTYKKVGSYDAVEEVTGAVVYRINNTGNYKYYPSAGVNIANVNYYSVTFYWHAGTVSSSFNSATAPSGALYDMETVPIVRSGEKGEKGEQGASVRVKDHYASKAALDSAKNSGKISPSDGDGYVTDDTGHLWVWSDEANAFVDCGQFKGDDGDNNYVHIAWSNNPDGTGFVVTRQTGADYDYMGTCTTHDVLDPTDKSAYSWIYVKGDQGIPGQDGEDGKNVAKVNNYYGWGTSGTTKPSKSAINSLNTIPAHPTGKDYLWNYEVYLDQDNTVVDGGYEDATCIGYFPKDGMGIKDIYEYYQLTATTTIPEAPSPSGTTPANIIGNWSQTAEIPTTLKPYLWNCEVVQYDDNSYSVGTPHCAGVKGDTGDVAITLDIQPKNLIVPVKVQSEKLIISQETEYDIYFYMYKGSDMIDCTSCTVSLYGNTKGIDLGNSTLSQETNSSTGKKVYHSHIIAKKDVETIQRMAIPVKVTAKDSAGKTYTREAILDFSSVESGVSVKGSQGIQGCVVRMRGTWSASEYYVNESNAQTPSDTATGIRYVDVVQHKINGTLMYFMRTKYTTGYVIGNTTKPSETSSYWKKSSDFNFVATELLLSKEIYTTSANANYFYVTDEYSNIQAGLQHVDDAQTPMIFAGANYSNANNAAFRVYPNGDAHIEGYVGASSGYIGGFGFGSDTDKVTYPNMTVLRGNENGSIYTTGSYYHYAVGHTYSEIITDSMRNESKFGNVIAATTSQIYYEAGVTNNKNAVAYFAHADGDNIGTNFNNFALFGKGNIALSSGIIAAYVPNRISKGGTISYKNGSTVIIHSLSADITLRLPTLADVQAAIGGQIWSSTLSRGVPFAVKMSITNISSSKKATIYGKGYQTEVASNGENPQLLDKDGNIITSGIEITRGRSYEILLYFNDSNYLAYLLNDNKNI